MSLPLEHWRELWQLTVPQWQRLAGEAVPLELAPRAQLWRPGSCPDEVILVRAGLLKTVFVSEEGRHYIKEFFWQGDAFFSYHSHLSGTPTPYCLEAQESCSLYVFSLKRLLSFAAKDPAWQLVYLRLLETQLRFKEEKEFLLLTQGPEARYLLFQRRNADLVRRLPDHQIAAYLGISPISLSRIKRRLNKG
ncbi:cAMP-binding protein [Zobellella endophytica]|uniref:cAMP-binding protein n=1 Tax=Zobellella endophytica TaxID=2116700 RepID=A0A2P7QXJ8_9GAMM|nr:Crp/Fnr family transcriptional regulator [Zobellella endophytica]PSJ42691.1 cAMP-binding protein [Zobellella endophytica]